LSVKVTFLHLFKFLTQFVFSPFFDVHQPYRELLLRNKGLFFLISQLSWDFNLFLVILYFLSKINRLWLFKKIKLIFFQLQLLQRDVIDLVLVLLWSLLLLFHEHLEFVIAMLGAFLLSLSQIEMLFVLLFLECL